MTEKLIEPPIRVRSWTRFISRGLRVAPEILGRSHQFSYNKARITISVPGIDKVDREARYDNVATVGTRHVGKPIDFVINSIDVETDLNKEVRIDPRFFSEKWRASDFFTSSQFKELNHLTETHEKCALEGYEYWLSVVRWIAGDYRIGRGSVEGSESGWGTFLTNKETGEKVWSNPAGVSVPGYTVVTDKIWVEVQRIVNELDRPPVHIVLLQEAEEYHSRGEYRRALIDLQISCETYARSTVLRALPSTLDAEYVKTIEDVGIRKYLNKFFPKLLTSETRRSYEKDRKELNKLFDIRNEMLHQGLERGVTRENCEKFIQVSKRFIAFLN